MFWHGICPSYSPLTLSGLEISLGQSLQERLHTVEQNFVFPPSAMAVQLSTARVGLTHCSESRAFLQADWPIKDQNSRTITRYQVFRDLRRRGFYLTSAGKFGGDFLVYPGEQNKMVKDEEFSVLVNNYLFAVGTDTSANNRYRTILPMLTFISISVN